MRRTLFGVIGHVDHGKSALVRALTGMDTDRLPEERRRGISIALGFAHFHADGAEIDLIDMPGHERFVRTMIAGATGLDGVLLVVAANEGVKPQTVEHVEIATLLGLRRAVVAVTKADLVDPDTLAAVQRQVIALVARAGLEAGPPVVTSTVAGTGIEALRAALVRCADDVERRDDGFCWLPIDRAFSVAGFGTVVTGTLRRGGIAVGDEVALLPDESLLRVRGLQVHGTAVASAAPGSRVAVNLRSIEASALGRGRALATPDCLAAAPWLTLMLRCVDSAAAPLRNGMRLQLLFGTAELEARLRLLDREELAPGDSAPAQLHCATPVFLPAGEHCVLRAVSPPRAVAGGRVLEAAARRLRRHDPTVLARLAQLMDAPQDVVLMAELQQAGTAGVSLAALARLVGLAPTRTVERLPLVGAALTRGRVAVLDSALATVTDAVPGVLERARAATLSINGLRIALAGVPSVAVLEEALHRLAVRERVRQATGGWQLVRPDEDRQQKQRQGDLAQRLAESLRRAGLSPPGPEEILAAHPEARRVLDGLRQSGVLVLTLDRVQKRQILFHRDAVAEARRKLAPLLAQPPGLLVKEAGAALGISRKYSVPLLEYFDAVQYTRRQGDRRMLLRPDKA